MSSRFQVRAARRLPRRPVRAERPRPRRRLGAGGVLARGLPPLVLAAAIVAVVLFALDQRGAAHGSARTEREVVTASDGIVQKTVTGTGNVEPVTDDDVDFQTSGTLSHVYVKQGEHVHAGQLLATLDDSSASLTVAEARATLTQARTTLTSDEKSLDDETSTASADDTSAAASGSGAAEEVDDDVGTTTPTPTRTTATTTPTRTTTPTPTTATTTTPTTATATTPTTTTATTRSAGTSTTSSSGSGSGATDVTAATIDSDKLTIVQDEATVKSDEADLAETRLRAPVSGTITSLESITPGESVSSGSDSSSDSGSSSTGDTTSSTSGAGATDTTTSSGSSTSSSTAFAEIDSLRHLSMTVSFTESDISELKVGEPATVTLDALSDVELAGKVTAVSSLGTTDDDVVSYDATITLDQYDSQVKPGMSASAAVIVTQGRGVVVPSSAVTGSGTLATVSEQVGSTTKTEKVIVGLRGTDDDLIDSGLRSGARLVETETLPATGSSASTSTTSRTSATSGFGGRGFGGGVGGGGFAGGGAGGPP